MICDNCQTEVPSDAVYCPKCGDRLDRRADPEEFAPAAISQDALASPEAEQPSSENFSGKQRFQEKVTQNRDGDDDAVEEDLWEGGYSPKAMLGHWLGAALISVLLLIGMIAFPVLLTSPIAWGVFVVVLVLLWGGVGALLLVRRLNVYYKLTSQRFIHKTGVLARTSDRIEVIDIDDVTFTQGLIERFVNVGTIKIDSSDRSHPVLLMPGIDDVQKVADTIDAVRRAERRRRGVHIEAI